MVTKTGTATKATHKMNEQAFWGYIFIAPLLLGLVVFYIYPFIQGFIYSFTDINTFNQSKFVGLENYKKMFSDPQLWQSTWNTIRYALIVVPIGLFFSLLTASLLNQDIRGKSAYRTLYFLPVVTMPAAIAMVWKWIFNGSYGVLNTITDVFGFSPQNWVQDPKYAMFMVCIVGIWMIVGYNTIILLAGIQGISRSYYEAASVDGAPAAVQFFKITLPMLTPTIFFIMITGLISAFQVFDVIYMMISKTSLSYESTQTLTMLFYRQGFDYSRKGYASAIAIFIFALIMIVTAFQLHFQKKWVHYDD